MYHCYSLRKQPTFREVNTLALPKRRLSNECRNSILMTCQYPDLRSASDWLKCEGIPIQTIKSTTWIWVVTCHRYGISVLVTQTSFCEGSSGDLARCQLLSPVACVASVSRSMHFSLFWPRENWGGRKKVRGGGGERREGNACTQTPRF